MGRTIGLVALLAALVFAGSAPATATEAEREAIHKVYTDTMSALMLRADSLKSDPLDTIEEQLRVVAEMDDAVSEACVPQLSLVAAVLGQLWAYYYLPGDTQTHARLLAEVQWNFWEPDEDTASYYDKLANECQLGL